MKKVHYVNNYEINPHHPLTVNLIGCGGTGSQVLTSLGRMNYALVKLGHPGLHVLAYDDDIVTDANCGRQLFSEQEIGMNKAVALVTKLNWFFGTMWEAVPETYGKGSDTANITITCVDTVASRQVVAERVKAKGSAYQHDMERPHYWMDFGNMADRGQVVLGTCGRTHLQPKKEEAVGILPDVTDVFDFDTLDTRDSGPSCSLAEALSKQDLFVNSTLAQMGCALLWKMFTKAVLDSHGLFLNLDTMRMTPMPIPMPEKK